MTKPLKTIKERNPQWFSSENKRLFGDISYSLAYGGKTDKKYLLRSTYAWTDMMGQPKIKHYRINKIEDDLKIGELIDIIFRNKNSAKNWLKNN